MLIIRPAFLRLSSCRSSFTHLDIALHFAVVMDVCTFGDRGCRSTGRPEGADQPVLVTRKSHLSFTLL